MNLLLFTKKAKGFALIEVTIALCVMGVLASAALPLFKAAVSYSKTVQTRRALEYALRSLAVYALENDRLPWAAPDHRGLENEDEKLIVGVLPYKNLCVEQQVVQDGYKNDLWYVVNPKLTMWIPLTPLSRQYDPFLAIRVKTNNFRVIQEDGSEAIHFDPEADDFGAAALIYIPPKSRYALQDIVTTDGAGYDTMIVIKVPEKTSGVIVRWISRNNIRTMLGLSYKDRSSPFNN
ncbi:MAG: type II secretion system GspH family protein [Holosporales bacterium]|jgi:prepilin-type N-terminal cleavage/methylation domain-containing protein|nr:type II secretion system GspH family protein [Holosporales bacterium]